MLAPPACQTGQLSFAASGPISDPGRPFIFLSAPTAFAGSSSAANRTPPPVIFPSRTRSKPVRSGSSALDGPRGVPVPGRPRECEKVRWRSAALFHPSIGASKPPGDMSRKRIAWKIPIFKGDTANRGRPGLPYLPVDLGSTRASESAEEGSHRKSQRNYRNSNQNRKLRP